MVTYGAPQKKDKRERSGNENRTRRKGRSVLLESQGIPIRTAGRDDTDSGGYPPRYSYRPNHNKYTTGTDSCIPLTPDRTGGERVVPSMIQDKPDDEGAADERDIWEVAHVTEEDFETTEGEVQELYNKLLEMAGWTPTVPEA